MPKDGEISPKQLGSENSALRQFQLAGGGGTVCACAIHACSMRQGVGGAQASCACAVGPPILPRTVQHIHPSYIGKWSR